MKKVSVFVFVILLSISTIYPQSEAKLKVIRQGEGSFIIVTEHQFHLKYGAAFPLTYRFKIPENLEGLKAREKYSSKSSWEVISEKKESEIFNDIEAVRFDYANGDVFVSSAFGSGDSLFIQICDGDGNDISAFYLGITKFYDNRKAAVTVSADDWYDEYNSMFKSLLDMFRSYGLYVTAGITTTGVTQLSWNEIQEHLDKGFVEAASHSRTHPFTPYPDAYGEICGSSRDIIENLRLPKYYSVDDREYVYVWLAPSGDYDAEVDSLVTAANYIVSRLYLNLPVTEVRDYMYGDTHISDWDEAAGHFEPFYSTVELGAPYWGGGDTSLTSLNNLFDSVVAKGGVYHPMWHPQVLIEDINKSYLKDHLAYISNHSDIWYCALGPLYLYQIFYQGNCKEKVYVCLDLTERLSDTLQIKEMDINSSEPLRSIQFELLQNRFTNISIYNTSAEKVLTLINQNMEKGIYELNLETDKLIKGNSYICQLTVGPKVYTQKFIQ